MHGTNDGEMKTVREKHSGWRSSVRKYRGKGHVYGIKPKYKRIEKKNMVIHRLYLGIKRVTAVQCPRISPHLLKKR